MDSGILIYRTAFILLGFILSINICSCSQLIHSKTSQKIIAEMIESDKDVYFERKTFSEIIDFTKTKKPVLIGTGNYQTNIKSALIFSNCTFEKAVLFYRTDKNNDIFHCSLDKQVVFIDCEFKDEVILKSNTMSHKLNFTKSHFFNKFTFEDCRVTFDVGFTDCIFEKEASFQNSHLYDNINFFGAQFKGLLTLQGLTCNRDLILNNAKTFGYTDLSLIKILGDALFNYTEFYNQLYISGSSFYGKVWLNANKIKKGVIKNSFFHNKFLFDKSTIEEDVVIHDNKYFIPHEIKNAQNLKLVE